MEQIVNFLIEDAKIIVAALWVIGYLLKGTPKVKSWLIPWVLLVISVVLTSVSLGGFTADNLIQAIIVAGVAIGGHQLYKQTKEGIEETLEEDELTWDEVDEIIKENLQKKEDEEDNG